MTTKKIMAFGITFVLAAMLLTSGNALNLSFAQPNTVGQTNSVDRVGTGDQSTNTGGSDNSDRQNYDDFQNCLDEAAGTGGFATEQQIRDCFTPIYIGSDDSSDNNNNDDSSDNNNDNNNN
ncbi:MAG TPA: hypothetical protein VFT71_09005 [Candidatus Nitrosocosmicus sp.]|nr:hypothetical protein [Candidatus Nitrosocosmicus sp.]